MAHWMTLRAGCGPRRRRARLVADGGGLENRYGGNLIVGSNPTPSARIRCPPTQATSSRQAWGVTVTHWIRPGSVVGAHQGISTVARRGRAARDQSLQAEPYEERKREKPAEDSRDTGGRVDRLPIATFSPPRAGAATLAAEDTYSRQNQEAGRRRHEPQPVADGPAFHLHGGQATEAGRTATSSLAVYSDFSERLNDSMVRDRSTFAISAATGFINRMTPKRSPSAT